MSAVCPRAGSVSISANLTNFSKVFDKFQSKAETARSELVYDEPACASKSMGRDSASLLLQVSTRSLTPSRLSYSTRLSIPSNLSPLENKKSLAGWVEGPPRRSTHFCFESTFKVESSEGDEFVLPLGFHSSWFCQTAINK